MADPPTPDAGLKLLTSPPIFDSIYELCGPATLCKIAKTCNGAHQAVKNYLKHTLNITKHLTQFFNEDGALSFRRLQAELQFIISGSQALQVLDRTFYAKSDLDVYVFPLDAEPVGLWLLAHGYEWVLERSPFSTFKEALRAMPCLLEDEEWQYEENRAKYGIPGVRGVFDFGKRTSTGTVLHVQIIVADVTPVEAVLRFHSTIVMNFITWDRAYALYPLATFEQRRGLVTYDKGRRYEFAISKYIARGFRIDVHLFDDEVSHGPFQLGTRWVGDESCWVVDLDTTGISKPADPIPFEANSWELGRFRQSGLTFGPCSIRTIALHSPFFRHRYCVTQAFRGFLYDVEDLYVTVEEVRYQSVQGNDEFGYGYGQRRPPGFTFRDVELAQYKKSFLRAREGQWTSNYDELDWEEGEVQY